MSAPRLEQALAASTPDPADAAPPADDVPDAVTAAGERLAIALAPVVAALDLMLTVNAASADSTAVSDGRRSSVSRVVLHAVSSTPSASSGCPSSSKKRVA